MDIPLNVEVHCSDGLVGHSSCIILNPVRQEITHFVLKRQDMLCYQEIVPVSLIKESNPDMILLRVSSHVLIDLDPFTQNEYLAFDGSEGMIGDYSYHHADLYAWPYREYEEPEEMAIRVEQIPHGELGIHRGAQVEATDGRVGRVDEFLVKSEDCHITHLVLRERHLLGDRAVTVPVSAIKSIEEDIVRLKLSREEVKNLPHISTHH